MKTLLRALLPAMITFGPVFITVAGSRAGTEQQLSLTLAGYAGAVALAIGLAVMFRDLAKQKEEIHRLRQLVDSMVGD